MRLSFVKCHGSGNDFPLIDARTLSLDDMAWAGVARALADRAGPVGGDGLLLLLTGDATHPIGFRMFNSDGSEAETCLNGVRCVARAGFAALGVEAAGVRLVGSVAQAAHDPDLAPGVYTVREVAGPASLDVAAWPMAIGVDRVVDASVPPLGDRRFTAVAIPNPHLVTFVEAVDEAELVRLGTICESAPDWLPRRANVSFVVVGEDSLFVRTFERGVGLTDSCGSAMAASTYAACLTGRWRFGAEVTVLNRGGLVRAMATEDAMVTIAGNATFEWEGEVTVDPAAGTASDRVVTHRYPTEIAAWDAVRARAAAFR
ncbi:diaminopimelate epimerase [Sphingomonas sp. KR1UV-12]|uniref:Diaminopimelate epimerase n=1 Tax=Sphingomonas aurea TaxID=3063994 RepID=A0ABT9EMB2_9SPHN|nr:diaminopimelate epimerase [Sphingomonas sp. KR1UV-12]MDP1028089.1 diaminopimelate epimerase [Sphingomonas sp. KR1UV-12]